MGRAEPFEARDKQAPSLQWRNELPVQAGAGSRVARRDALKRAPTFAIVRAKRRLWVLDGILG
jgi:hypothetical protein